MAEVVIHRQPRIAKKGSYKVTVKAGESYWWCSCGHSLSQPFCDGSHNKLNEKYGTNFQPIEYKATEDKDVWFCGCKRSPNAPLCDGSHSKLSEDEVKNGTFPSVAEN